MRTNKHIALSPQKYRLLLYTLIAIAFIGFAVYGAKSVVHLKGSLNSSQIKLKNNQVELKNLNTQLDKEKLDKNASQEQIQKLEQEKKDLESQLQAKADAKAKLAEVATAALNTVTATKTVSAAALPNVVVANCGDNSYANYIYMHESSCSTTITNSEGCMGIGQACPASKLLAVCPNADYACENLFFTGYAIARYGSWEGAYNFWINNHWW